MKRHGCWGVMAVGVGMVLTGYMVSGAPAGANGEAGVVQDPPETETVAFMGVGVVPVDPVLGAELELAKGVGLRVNHVEADSQAAHRVHFNDVLHMLDDQLLVNAAQLRVLIRTYVPGDEVRLRLFRGGVPMDVTIALGSKEVPAGGFGGGQAVQLHAVPGRGGQGTQGRIRLGGQMGGGHGATTVFRFDAGGASTKTVTITEDGKTYSLQTETKRVRNLQVKDPEGNVLFEGEVNTPEEREKVPENIREKLARLEGTQQGGVDAVIQIQTQNQP